jgi:hypothetical protein
MSKPIDTSDVVSIDLAMEGKAFVPLLLTFLSSGVALFCVFAAISSIGDP